MEKEKLEIKWTNREIELKEYLHRKKEIKEKIEAYSYWLKETRFEHW